MRRRFIYRDGEAHEVSKDYVPEPTAPMVMPDIQPYQSMCDGSMITSRSKHREHLKAHGVIEVGNEKITPRADLRNTGVKEALIRSVQQAKDRYGSRHVESAISDALNKAHELRRR